jgi:hypothetical protein
VYASSDLNNSLSPVGALLFGDIVNGKSGIVDLVEDEFSDCGFTGIVAYNETSDTISPLTGVYASYSQKMQYSYDVQGGIDDDVREAYEHMEAKATQSTINGEVLKYQIKRLDLSFRLDSNDDEILLPEYYPPIMLIRGTSLSQWDSFKRSNLALAVSTVIAEFLFMVGTFVLLYRPIHKFAMSMESMVSFPKAKSMKVVTKVINVVSGHGSSNNGSTHQNTRTEEAL